MLKPTRAPNLGGRTGRAWRSVALYPVPFIAAFLLISYIQSRVGARGAAFTAYPDEPSHFLSGVMIRDYMAWGLSDTPIRWATNYYAHVPYFAVGHWPPLFYMVEAVWFLLFGVGRVQALMLIAAIGALATATIVGQAGRSVGLAGGACAGLFFLLWPPVQWSNCAVMTDTTVALFSLWASLALGRFLDTERTGPALLFGVCAGLAVLTKYSALVLLAIPFAAVILTRRWQLLKSWPFWSMDGIVALLWLPWLLGTMQYAKSGFSGRPGDGAGQKVAAYLKLIFETGLPLGILLCLGWLLAIFFWRRLEGREIVWLIQIPAGLLFIAVAPIAIEPRYLMPVFGLLILLSFSLLGRINGFARNRVVVPALLILTAVYVTSNIFHFETPRANDVRPVAEFVLRSGIPNTSILVPADNEGAFIAEVAGRDRNRLQRVLARPSKLLATMDWNGGTYQPLYTTPSVTEAFFENNPVDLVVIHFPVSPNARTHEVLLAEMVEKFPDRWRLVREFPEPHGPYRVYRFQIDPQKGKFIAPASIRAVRSAFTMSVGRL